LPISARRSFLALFACLCLLLPATVSAQSDEGTGDAPTDAAMALEEWTGNLDRVEQTLGRADTTAESADKLRSETEHARREAENLVRTLEPKVASLERRIEALGPVPEEGQPEESQEVSQRRAVLSAQLRKLNGQLTQARLILLRVQDLDSQIGSLSQRKRFEALFRAYPAPWSAEAWQRALSEFGNVAKRIGRSPAIWWHGLEAEQRREILSLRVAALLVLALAVGWFLRHWLISRYGRNTEIADPSYSQRLVAALANAMARGIVPAMFAGLFYVAWSQLAMGTGMFWSLVELFLAVMAFFSLAWAVPYAVLSPDLPQWRLLAVSPDNARRLGWRFTLLAALFAFVIFVFEALQSISVSDPFFSLATFLLTTLLALPLIEISRQTYWKTAAPVVEDAAADAEAAEPEAAPVGPGLWGFLRRLIAPIAGISIVAAFLGYADLADFLISNLLLSMVTLAAVAILRGLARELIGAGLRSDFMRDQLQLRHLARNRLKFWLRAILDVTFFIGTLFFIAAIWASPFGEFWVEARSLLSGVTIGGVTISFYDMLVALIIFAAILLLTRLGQRVLSKQVLPQTGFDSGVQNSLSAGFGYIGIMLAAVFGISALGIDLSNIALIAGALSVGIGFGLQAIVSNFVSGIILLIERPIKVGDWVLVGGNEGTVKRITVRSTELQTFQRASVIIPNSDFISTAVINWTHKDTYGRIEIPVGVAYGSDVEKVREVLLECAQHHERVLTSPEPQVMFMNFGNSSLDFELRCYTSDVSFRLSISSDLRFAIDKVFREANIEIPFPQHVVHFADRAVAEALPNPLPPEAGPKASD
jgi:potassium-dependent mechanosensitive channel